MSIYNPAQWAVDHFQHANLGDPRRSSRLVHVSEQMATASGHSFARACNGEGAKLEGAYRLIRNDNVSPACIRTAGFAHTAQLAKGVQEILAIEDTTSLSYKHQVSSALGKLGKPTDKARGWWVHSTLLLDSHTTQTIGLIHQDWWCRPDNPEDANEKESGKWADSSLFCRQRLGDLMPRVISVCDREADILSYLQNKQSYSERFVVRAKHGRKLKNEEDKLFEHMDKQSVIGGYTVNIPQKGMKNSRGKAINRQRRTARLTIKAAQVHLKGNRKSSPCINVVYAQEKPTHEGSISWMLLTSEPIDTLEQVLRVIDIYSARWRIEDFHKAWKTGAGAERQRMVEPDNLERAVSILAFIGVRLLKLREALTLPIYLRKKGLVAEARNIEQQPCNTVFEEDEWKVLIQLYKPKNKAREVPSLKWAYQSLAKLGGFNDTKRTGIACWSTVWEGWDTLQSHVVGYRLAKNMVASGKAL